MAETGSTPTSLRLDRSIAKQLFFGDIVEENLFPYPCMRERDREMLGMMLDSIDDFLAAHKDELNRWDDEAQQPESFITTTCSGRVWPTTTCMVAWSMSRVCALLVSAASSAAKCGGHQPCRDLSPPRTFLPHVPDRIAGVRAYRANTAARFFLAIFKPWQVNEPMR